MERVEVVDERRKFACNGEVKRQSNKNGHPSESQGDRNGDDESPIQVMHV